MLLKAVQGAGALLSLESGSTQARVVLSALSNPGIQLLDQQGRKRIDMRYIPEDAPEISLYDTDGNRRLELGTLSDGGRLTMKDRESRNAVSLYSRGGRGKLVLGE